jgi:hypothetical protein
MEFYPVHYVGMGIDSDHKDSGCFSYWIEMDIDIVTNDSLCCFGP